MYSLRMRFISISSLFIVGVLALLQLSSAQVLTPPYFNLAQGRRIVATSTCGEGVAEPELYCKLVGRDIETESKREQPNVIQGQFCDHCDPNNEEKRHPAEYAVDGRETRWQSPPLSRGMFYNQVNLTIDLGQEFHVAYVIVKMGNSPRPGVWALERSNDNGQTFHPWQYFADTQGECENFFGSHVNFRIVADDTVICTTEFSKIVPLEGGEIVVPLVQNRPSANDFFNSTILQEWTRATNVRFRLLRVKNLLGHLMSIANQDTTTTRRYFYSIKDISIGGRCRCNGHADTCTSIDQNDPYRLVCDCKDHTCGNNCETCCPGFEQKKWSQSKTNRRFVCEPCNCFGHTDQCVYNETVDNLNLSLDIHGKYDGGGVCQHCQHNTEGVNCDKCIHGYFRPYGKQLNDTDVCKKCQCDFYYSTGDCEDGYGRCECKPEYTKPNCDSCSYGHYGFPLCRPCSCFINGTSSSKCEPENGQCDCKNNFGGQFCKYCAEGFYNFSLCQPCECNPIGSSSSICDVNLGECNCKNSFGGKNCDLCSDGYHSFPSCLYCSCDIKGTLPEICNKNSGQCLCKPGYGGARCDQCLAGFTGFPNCVPCNCSTVGSAFEACDINGKCTCSPRFGGKQCDQCSPGFYQFPNCTACNCDPYGTQGSACREDGTCVCKDNFDGEKCNECKRGYYNYATCEKCTYNPAGVISNFTGCTFDKPGDLKTILCKKNVQGRECSDCRELFWNLQTWNPNGCENCDCNLNGTIGQLATCNSNSGQCVCKPAVQSRQCDECIDGHYNLTIGNLFGCSECGCDVGGAMSGACNKITGQCRCLPRVFGRTCKQPSELHYFPTLHQYRFEVEDGRTPTTPGVRYGFNDFVLPGFSWKGYAIFSHLQNETFHEVFIDKPSVYRMILRYMNPNNIAISGTVSVVPDMVNNLDAEQKFQVVFKPTPSPTFVTVAGISGNNPSPFVMNPGGWIVKLKIEKSLFLDYFVLIPAEYYEASLLISNVTNPCTIDETKVCRHYSYPNVSSFDHVRGAGGYLEGDGSRSPSQHYFYDYEESQGIPKMPVISDVQPELHLDMRVSRPGSYVFVVVYATEKDQDGTNLAFDVRTPKSGNKGVVPIRNCRYTSLCRQVILDSQGRNATFDLDSNFISLILKGAGKGVGIDTVVAIPSEKWSLGYIQPKPACLMKDKVCTTTTYNTPPDSKKIDFRTGNEDHIAKSQPSTILDNTTELVLLNSENPMVDLKGKVSKPGPYVFVVHYYQPDFPEFDVDILIQNGIFYEAKIPFQHCPSNTGCRAVVRQISGNMQFQLPENFVFSVKKPNDKYLWLHYLLVVPSIQYSDQLLTELPYDQTAMFISQCGLNNFHLNTSEEGFCKEATFSLTTKYNHGTLECSCDYEGATSFECAPFGGQCPCKPHVIGRQCNACKTGYFNFPNCEPCSCPSTAVCDPFTGECVCPLNVIGEKCNTCKDFTFGFDPIMGCVECNCDYYGVKRGNMQCDLQTGACDCKDFIEGRTCDRCIAGHWQFPYCAPCECDLRGTTVEVCNQTNADCFCKPNVHGQACDICNDGTFNLQFDNEEGCTKCFCFGKTSRCSSSTLFVSSVNVLDNWKLANVDVGKTVEISELPTNVEKINGGIEVNLGYVLGGVSYFVAPQQYNGNKLTSYGSYLNYTLHYRSAPEGRAVGGHDVILYGSNMYLMYESVDAPSAATHFPVPLKIVESNFMTLSGSIVTREELMQVLQNLTAIYIKATYSDKPEISQILSVSLEIATPEYNQNLNVALSVEQCHCPPNYVGLSCEECADGFYRVSSGPFGGYCVPCQCNGHAASCDKVTGVCTDCKHNTKGDHCEKCETKYYGNATIGTPSDCLICACPLPIPSNNFATECVINDIGDKIICECEPGFAGDRCERCAPGFYGRPEIPGEKCVPCQCNNNINPLESESCDHETGRCLKCLNNTYGTSCEKCAPGYFGDAVLEKNCQPCDCDTCGTRECDHKTGKCTCRHNVIGEKCDRCADNHFEFTTCQGCVPCNCQNASDSQQCDDLTGYCRCKPGVTGQWCDRCSPGHWKYTADGCSSCGCKTEYSLGFGCNVNTGMCECLPGVVGNKCNQCPYRWVLIPNEGCFPCDKCHDGLLDVTDRIVTDFEPIFNHFQSASIAYFTVQRLKFINETADKYAPNVTDVLSHQFDLTPYGLQIAVAESEVENSRRSVQSIYNNAFTAVKTGETNNDLTSHLEMSIAKVIDGTRMTVFEVNGLAFSLETGAVRQIDYALHEAKDILTKVNDLDLDEENKQRIEETLDKANNTSTSVTEFSQPLNKTISKIQEVKEKHELLYDKLDELDEYSEKAHKAASTASEISQMDKKAKVVERVNSLSNITSDAMEALHELPELTRNTTKLLQQAKQDFEMLVESKQNLMKMQSQADHNMTSLENELKKAREESIKSRKHADEISAQAAILEATIKHQVSSNEAVEAANAYSTIEKAVLEALENLTVAKEEVQLAAQKSEGLIDKLQSSLSSALATRDKAMNSLKETQQELSQALNNVEQQQNIFDKNLNQTTSGLENILAQLKTLQANQDKPRNRLKELNVDAMEGNTKQIPDDIRDVSENVPKKLKEAKELYQDRNNKKKALQDTSSYLDKLDEQIPEMKRKIDKITNMPTQLNESIKIVADKLDALKREISHVRGAASKIKVGVTLSPRTSLELPVPATLVEQGSSTDLSLYFRTNEQNALLFYLGNDATTKRQKRDILRKPRTDDFLALLLINGYPQMKLHLGAQRVISIIAPTAIRPNEWHNARIERTGKVINFTITDAEGIQYSSTGEGAGLRCVLNLDKDNSKFYIGGIPDSFHPPNAIEFTTFSGQFESLIVNGEPIGLWNFVDVLTPEDVPISRAITGAKERNVLQSNHTSTACRFNGDGFVKLPPGTYWDPERTDILINFKTTALDGLLYLVFKELKFVTLEIRGGFVYFRYNLGKGLKQLHSNNTYNDGEWHNVEATRYGNQGILKVDGKVLSKDANSDSVLFEMPDHVFVGGFEGSHKLPDIMRTWFEGCMDFVQIEGTNVNLKDSVYAYKVTAGCIAKFSNFVSFKDGHGFVSWPDPRLNLTWSSAYPIELTLRIKTKAKSALISYGTDGNKSFFLLLSNGVIIFKIGNQEVRSSPNMKYNDDRWHAIMAALVERKLHLIIDDFEVFESPQSVTEVTNFDTTGRVYFGTVPAEVDAGAAIEHPFDGCIGDVTFNGVVINFEDVAEGRDATIGQCSGPGTDIKPKGDPNKRPTHNTSWMTSTSSPEPSEPVTAAPGSLPLVPAKDLDVTDESGIRFGTAKNSVLVYDFDPSQVRKAFSFSIDLKTVKADGIVFYVGNRPQNTDAISLYIKESNLRLKYRCGPNNDILTIPMVNQAEWHTAKVNIHENGAELTINENRKQSSFVGCSSISFSSPFHVGGVDDTRFLEEIKVDFEDLNKTFIGCIRNFKPVGQQLLEPRQVNVIPCSSKVEEGTFFSSDGYVRIFETFKVGKQIDIKMEIKPRNLSGLILAVHSKKDFLVLQMIDGSIKFTVENGNGPVAATYKPHSQYYFLDNQFHKIAAVKRKNVIVLTVDGEKPLTMMDFGGSVTTDTNHPFYVGGYPATLAASKGIETSSQFIGCMKDLEINGKTEDLSSYTAFGNVMFNVCPTI